MAGLIQKVKNSDFSILKFLLLVISLLLIFIIYSRTRSISIYNGSIILQSNTTYEFVVPTGTEVKVSNTNVLGIYEVSSDINTTHYEITGRNIGTCTLTVIMYSGTMSGTKTEYYDVVVCNTFDDSTEIYLKRLDNDEEVLVMSDQTMNDVYLELGASYKIYVNKKPLDVIKSMPCTKLNLINYDMSGELLNNITINDDNVFKVTSAVDGKISLESSVIGKLDINYKVKCSMVPFEDILEILNESVDMPYEKDDINLNLTSGIGYLKFNENMKIFSSKSEYIDEVFPNLEKIVIKCDNDGIDLGCVKVPEAIETIYFESVHKYTKNNFKINLDRHNYANVDCILEGNGNSNLNIIFDGSIKVSPSYEMGNNTNSIFSKFNELNITSKNGFLDVNANNFKNVLSCIKDVKDLYLNVDKFNYEDEDDKGNCVFELEYALRFIGGNGDANNISGANAIQCENLYLYMTRAIICTGGYGYAGKNGYSGTTNGRHGTDGENGYIGGTGGSAIVANTLDIKCNNQDNSVLVLTGGGGGNGGNGGNGGQGKNCDANILEKCNPGNGGNAGIGGSGGDSGYSLLIENSITGNLLPLLSSNASLTTRGGGNKGNNGTPGKRGYCGCWFNFDNATDAYDGKYNAGTNKNGDSNNIYLNGNRYSYEEFYELLK